MLLEYITYTEFLTQGGFEWISFVASFVLYALNHDGSRWKLKVYGFGSSK